MVKINFENLPSTNTPLSAENLNQLQTNVETAIDGKISNTSGTSQTIGYSQEFVNKLNTYSTNEIKVGTWINNKPIYRKTKVFSSSDTTFNYGGEKTLNISISNVDEIINYKAFYKRSDGSFQQVPNSHSVMSYWGSSLYDFKTNGNCTFWVGTLYNVFTIDYLVITIEYTKTTD